MFTRLAALASLALLVTAPAAASAATSPPPGPVGLRAFLLRADDAPTNTYARTPSFAWTPSRGATRYDFDLATSKAFTQASIVWSSALRTSPLRTPVVSIPVSLPWMTGSPYALYARVRAVTDRGTSAWSTPFGFNMTWTSMPDRILPDYPGLVRWTPVEGATSYEVWFLDPGKIIQTITNAADEREYYTFHLDPSWTGTVHWRVRAVRRIFGTLPNGLPAVVDGPWSPIYTSTNPTPSIGALSLTAAVSEVASTPDAPKVHALTPAFVYSGNEGVFGEFSDLYRVYVSTDKACVNVVYTGPVTGSPAYAPRLSGPLALPTTKDGETAAAGKYLDDGTETGTFTADYRAVSATEGAPTTAPAGQAFPSDFGADGPAIDLWDSGWPAGRYYWTVVPVEDVIGASNTIQYYDLELPQDACAAGRVIAFGKTSQTAITTVSGRPFATGLTPDGAMISAQTSSPQFYGTPLIAWEPAAGATGYEVQVSHTAYPWKQAAPSLFTGSTSALLEGLKPGTWYYRVRGIDPFLSGPIKQMAWSKPAELVLSRPTFTTAPSR